MVYYVKEYFIWGCSPYYRILGIYLYLYKRKSGMIHWDAKRFVYIFIWRGKKISFSTIWVDMTLSLSHMSVGHLLNTICEEREFVKHRGVSIIITCFTSVSTLVGFQHSAVYFSLCVPAYLKHSNFLVTLDVVRSILYLTKSEINHFLYPPFVQYETLWSI